MPPNRAAMAQTPCRFFQAGYCARGDTCWYKHDASEEEVNKPVASTSSGSGSGVNDRLPKGQAPRPGNKSDAPASSNATGKAAAAVVATEEHECGICFNVPKLYGLLDCSHCFCMSCIKTWRDPRTKTEDQLDNASLIACPACRVKSQLVVPSPVFHPNGTNKDGVIASYKARCKTIPCRNFNSSDRPGQCSFGSDCLYSHKDPETGEEVVLDHTHEEWLERSRNRRHMRQRRDQMRAHRALNMFYDLIHPDLLDYYDDEDDEEDYDYEDEVEDDLLEREEALMHSIPSHSHEEMVEFRDHLRVCPSCQRSYGIDDDDDLSLMFPTDDEASHDAEDVEPTTDGENASEGGWGPSHLHHHHDESHPHSHSGEDDFRASEGWQQHLVACIECRRSEGLPIEWDVPHEYIENGERGIVIHRRTSVSETTTRLLPPHAARSLLEPPQQEPTPVQQETSDARAREQE